MQNWKSRSIALTLEKCIHLEALAREHDLPIDVMENPVVVITAVRRQPRVIRELFAVMAGHIDGTVLKPATLPEEGVDAESLGQLISAIQQEILDFFQSVDPQTREFLDQVLTMEAEERKALNQRAVDQHQKQLENLRAGGTSSGSASDSEPEDLTPGAAPSLSSIESPPNPPATAGDTPAPS